MYRHRDFVIYQKGGKGVSFYKNDTKKNKSKDTLYFNTHKIK